MTDFGRMHKASIISLLRFLVLPVIMDCGNPCRQIMLFLMKRVTRVFVKFPKEAASSHLVSNQWPQE